ncbi:protein disulfide isomerase-like 1-6 [Cajanus cajan]|uniref:protein disulfide-isomerase n=1 Tax=Cajanus cajan TaxID=3821 RepID=A0A151QT09_CAJCA|nr:protein disulfide isomerase-like 1-6 [Cajanus cajan]KYP33451.1 Protein disulfide-isomerase [Cajanus cajan]
MCTRKPTLTFIFFLLTLLLTPKFNVAGEGEDELEELLAVDEEVEREIAEGGGEKLSEAEVLSKAQRIVVELNNDNTERVVNGNEFVLVLGYAPWCPRSAELMPHFAESATSLKELGAPLLMAKIDADRYPKSASFLGIKGFPTLLLFLNGTSQPYSGGFTADDIVIWARKKTGAPVVRISSVAEAEGFLRKYQTFLVGLFEKFEGPDYEEFVNAAKFDNETQFVAVSQLELAQVLYPDIKLTDHFIGIVKSEPERYTAYDGAFTMNKILEFVDHNKFPLVTKLTEMNSISVYSSPIKLQVLVFANSDDFKNLLNTLQDVARTLKSKIMFIYVDIDDENLAKPFLTLLGLEESKNTVVAAFDNGMSSKYLLESKPTQSNIEEFCNNLVRGSLSPYFKSQPIPDNTEASVHVIVGKTFDDEILRSEKDVLLEVFTPWCMNCEATSKQVEKLAKHYKGSSNLIFARIDASANEHPKLEVNDYPTLLLFRANEKANPIKLSTKSSLKELAASINKYLKVKNQVVKDEL